MKRSWPGVKLFSPDWDKRDLIHLYKDIGFISNLEEVSQGLDYSPTFSRFKRLHPQVKTPCASYLEYRSHNALEICLANEVRTEVKLYWSTEVKKLTRGTEEFLYQEGQATRYNAHIKLKRHFKSFNWWFPLLLGS